MLLKRIERQFILAAIIVLFFPGCENSINQINVSRRIIWSQEIGINNKSFICLIERYIGSWKVEEKGYAIYVEVVINTSQSVIFSIHYVNPDADKRWESSEGYFYVGRTKCFIFSGIESFFQNIEGPYKDYSRDYGDEFLYARLDRTSGKVEYIRDGDEMPEVWEIVPRVKELPKTKIH